MGTGNPAKHDGACNFGEVYPRGHGESVIRISFAGGGQGLSPWARGIQASIPADADTPGSIPVGTGNPPPS